MRKLTLFVALLLTNSLFAQTGVGIEEPYLPIMCPPGDVTSPSWLSSVNRLYNPCPKVRVGIGTHAPNAQLHVVSNEPGISLRLQTTNWNNADLVFQSATGQSDVVLENGSGNMYGLLRFGAESEGPSMVFQNRMGGTITELFKVSSTGTVYAHEIIVRAAPFPDYVFDIGYDLMPLKSVKEFIQVNGHLPNIPSAEEVESNGMGVSDMLVHQMEKIEELTLYLIEINEHVDELEKKNLELQQKLIELNKD